MRTLLTFTIVVEHEDDTDAGEVVSEAILTAGIKPGAVIDEVLIDSVACDAQDAP